MNAPLKIDNPFFEIWDTPFATPPFSRIRPAHFRPAFEHAIAAHKAEIEAIAANPQAPTFENVVIALEKAGSALTRVENIFDYLKETNADDEIDEISEEFSPVLSRHRSDIYQNVALFKKIGALLENRKALSTQQQRALEKYYRWFLESGAALGEAAKNEIKFIEERLSTLTTVFEQNVDDDEKAFALPLTSNEDCRGLSQHYLAAAANDAAERGMPGRIATLSKAATAAFLRESSRRDLREIVFKAWKARGANNNEYDNKKNIEEIARRRSRFAKILKFDTYAYFKLSDKMAQAPEVVRKLHADVWGPARQKLLKEIEIIETIARADGLRGPLQPWDWPYYAEKVRQQHYAVDENKVRAYLPLDGCIDAMFYAAHRLFGLNFTERKDIEVCHPDIRTWEVTDKEGRHVTIFYGDYFARSGKKDGAFQSEFRTHNKLAADNPAPLVYNVCSFRKTDGGEPTLLTLKQYREDLFHEFGHALHEMLTEADFPSLAGTDVLGDFVELPAQLFELSALDDAVLTKFARHYQTGEVMPQELREKIRAADTFNMGFETAEFIASSALDLEWHSLQDGEVRTVEEIERTVIDMLKLPDIVQPLHLSTHFVHITSGYDSSYYSYLWAEMLKADAAGAFVEAGDVFDPKTARRLRTTIYAPGDSRAPQALFQDFRGRGPVIQPLLKERGFSDDAEEAPLPPPAAQAAVRSSPLTL